MIKGVNKQIIEINDMDNKVFEKAVLYVRPEYSDMAETKLRNSANEFAKQVSDWDLWCIAPKPPKSITKNKAGKRQIIVSLVATGTVVVAVILTLLKVL